MLDLYKVDTISQLGFELIEKVSNKKLKLDEQVVLKLDTFEIGFVLGGLVDTFVVESGEWSVAIDKYLILKADHDKLKLFYAPDLLTYDALKRSVHFYEDDNASTAFIFSEDEKESRLAWQEAAVRKMEELLKNRSEIRKIRNDIKYGLDGLTLEELEKNHLVPKEFYKDHEYMFGPRWDYHQKHSYDN